MKKNVVGLKKSEKEKLHEILRKGNHTASVRNRAQVLLLSDQGKKDQEIADVVFMSWRAVAGIRQRYKEKGFEGSLFDEKRSGRPKKYTTKDEAELTAIACTDPPEGRVVWTLEMLQEEMQKNPENETIAKNTIRLMLKKIMKNHGNVKCGVSED